MFLLSEAQNVAGLRILSYFCSVKDYGVTIYICQGRVSVVFYQRRENESHDL